MLFIPWLLATILALFIDNSTTQSLPYNPTSVFLSPLDTSLAYVFLSSSPSTSQSQLVSLNISATITTTNLTFETLTYDLPFSDGSKAGDHVPFIPSISPSGSIGVYAGSCTERSSFWIFHPSSDPPEQNVDNGTWREMSVSSSPSVSTINLPNVNFLASSFSFSSLVDANDTQRTVYAFGGMCPNSISNSTTWQSSANYSNNMLLLSYSSPTSYELSLSSNVGNSPIPEAGFTTTALASTFSNSSAGIMTQAQNFVLLGGHTSTAFINMSQVAVFSLPQEVWSFQSIDSAPEMGGTELAVKSASLTTTATPDSRSGHTAVLSSDGSSIFVFGGWVGDVNTPAQPQLAVLHPGSGFGGSGDWFWEIPKAQGTGLPAGEGLYGHGAVMLPGDVMMVIGGHQITSSGPARLSKKADTVPNASFLNTTSMVWSSDYTNPSYIASVATSSGSGGPLPDQSSSNSKKVGLGAGLGLGLGAVLAAIIVYFWYARRLKKRRQDAREKDLQELSRSAADYYAGHGANSGSNPRQREDWWALPRSGEMEQREYQIPPPSIIRNLGNRGIGIGRGSGGGYAPVTYTPSGFGDHEDKNSRPMLQRSSSGRSSSSIPRKPVNTRNARGYYQPTPSGSTNQSYSGFDFGTSHSRANSLGTAGVIHPIYEADEDQDISNRQNQSSGANLDSDVGRAASGLEDPFLDPQATVRGNSARSNQGSRPGTSHEQYKDRVAPTPESAAQERELEIKEWVAGWAAADALLNSRAQSISSGGRLSPSKESGSGRTESSLSERSVATVSALGLSRNGSTRSNSLTAFFSGGPISWNPFAMLGNTPAGLGSITEHGHGDVSPTSEHASLHGGSRGLHPPPSSGSATSSFTTAHTSQSISALRAEGESLLPRPHEESYEGSPSKSKAAVFARRQQGGWLGSLKRVFTTTDEEGSASGSARSSPTRGHRSPSVSNSPTRMEHGMVLGGEPRRAISATATMWRRKQGRDDWEDSAEPRAISERSNTLTLDGSWRPAASETLVDDRTGEDEEEWDIERAIERRVVQVMFTVPKEKLRVVNHDMKADEEDSEAGSIKDTEKVPDIGQGEVISYEPISRASSPGKGKGKGKVQEIVEKMEHWNG